jgi:hypothetical protein
MKRFIAAASFAVFAAPAAAAGVPYMQNVVDRTLPNIEVRAASSGETAKAPPAAGLPYEQYAIDRILPNIDERAMPSEERGKSIVDAKPGSPWANDYHFVAPTM